MEAQDLSSEQKTYLNQSLEHGVAFEEMVRSKGWSYVLDYITARVQGLTSEMLTSDAPIETFEGSRLKVAGMRELLTFVESQIKILEDNRNKPEEGVASE